MSYDCYCDYDAPEFYIKETRKARKQHQCEECSGPIVPGEQYEHVRGKWAGDVDTFKTCQRCHDIRQWVTNNVPCFCWAHGSMIENADEAIAEAQSRAREETKGLRFGFLRRIVQRNRINAARRLVS